MAVSAWRDIPEEEPVISAENFSAPGPAESPLVRYRGAWTVGTLYNVNEMVRYAGDGSQLLMLCLATHVAEAEFDLTKWARLADMGSLGEGASVEQIDAALTAVLASQAVVEAIETALTGLESVIDQTATEVGVNAQLALEAKNDALVQAARAALAMNSPPGTEWEPGRMSGEGLLAAMQDLLGLAPALDEVTFGDHTGEEGTNGVTATLNATAAHLNGLVRFVRQGTTRHVKYKVPANTYTQPNKAGKDGAYAYIALYNDSVGGAQVTVEGTGNPSSAGDVTLTPTRLVEPLATNKSTVTSEPAVTVTVPVVVPAGSNRMFMAYAIVIYHITPTTAPVLAVTNLTGVSILGTDGGGGHSSSDPLHIRAWEGEVAGTAEVPDAELEFSIQVGWAAYVVGAVFRNNCSGYEDVTVLAVADAADNEVTATVNPADAGASVDIVAAFHGGDADTGLGITPGTDLRLARTGSRSLKDIAYARQAHDNRPAASQVYTAVSDKLAPRAVISIAWKPVISSTGGGGVDNIKPAAIDRVLDAGEGALLKLRNDGLTILMTRT